MRFFQNYLNNAYKYIQNRISTVYNFRLGTRKLRTSELSTKLKAKIVIQRIEKTMKFITSAILASALMASQIAIAQDWAFDVYLDKNKIGQHTFSLNEANELTSKAIFNVKVLFINAYQYDHKATEKWQGDCLVSLDAHTVENKVVTDIKGRLVDKDFVVEGGKAKQNLPVCTMTFAYWNPKMLTQTKLLNPQNAEWLDTKITKLGTEKIDVKGKNIEATHYKLDGSLEGKNKLKIELWYNANNDWVALKSITPEGYTINYKLR